MIEGDDVVLSPNSRSSVVIGVDVGTTNCKVVALDHDGQLTARASRPTPRSPEDLSIDAASLLHTIEDMLVEACGNDFAIAAISVAGIGEDGLLVDHLLQPVGQALAWFDPRRRRLFKDLQGQLTPEPTGLGVGTDSSRTIVGWLWSTAQPGQERADSWLSLCDYAPSVWSGTPFMSDTLAARTSAWLPETRTWIQERVTATLHEPDLLPPVKRAGDIVGPFVAPRLRDAGILLSDAIVVVGGHDHPVGGWGISLLDPRAILDSMGTAEVVVAQRPDLSFRGILDVNVEPGIRSPGTTLLKVEELARNADWASQDPEVARCLAALITGAVEPDSFFDSAAFHPGTRGGGRPRYDRNAPSNPFSRASSVMGALARIGDAAIDAVAANMTSHTEIYAAGGWSRSAGWMRAKARVSGRDIHIVGEPEVTAVGAAMLAASAIQWPLSAAQSLAGPSRPAIPRPPSVS